MTISYGSPSSPTAVFRLKSIHTKTLEQISKERESLIQNAFKRMGQSAKELPPDWKCYTIAEVERIGSKLLGECSNGKEYPSLDFISKLNGKLDILHCFIEYAICALNENGENSQANGLLLPIWKVREMIKSL